MAEVLTPWTRGGEVPVHILARSMLCSQAGHFLSQCLPPPRSTSTGDLSGKADKIPEGNFGMEKHPIQGKKKCLSNQD